MAKRIKIKGKTPRGLSKTDRRAYADAVKNDDYDLKLSTDRSPRNISSTPSSTRKKLVKEGNRKFIGPRQLKSELKEDREARVRDTEGFPVKYIENRRGPGRAGHIYEVDEGGIWPFEASRREIRKYDRLRKENNPSSRRRAREILERLFARYYGGGQEFDAQY